MEKTNTEQLQKIVQPLLLWFEQNKRVLPWREEPTPYRVWVSEIMLQQTRVEAVKPYFERFMKSLPQIKDLAEVDEEQLLKLWEGLGYYNRARNLQKAAVEIMEQHEGKMPDDYEKLLSLPGIGSYTAGAVASISFQICQPAVDGNVLRVFSRLTMNQEDILSQKVKKYWENIIRELIPKGKPGDFNQALMELGATVCVPNGAPHCEECPLKKFCEAHKASREMEFPYKKQKKQRRIEQKTILIICDGDKIVLRKRDNKGLLAGLYEFPSMEGHVEENEVITQLENMGYKVLHIKKLTDGKHIFSHVEWHMTGYKIKVQEGDFEKRKLDEGAGHILVKPKETEVAYPIPSAFRIYQKCIIDK